MWGRLAALIARLRFVVTRKQWDADADREIESHIELLIERYVRLGMTVDEARLAAHRRFGSRLAVREDIHRMNSIGWLEEAAVDARHAVRLLIKNPSFATASCVTLALGIGATTAMFSVVNAVLLRPLPFPDADRLVRITARGEQPAPVPSADELLQLRAATRALTAVHGYDPIEMSVQAGESARLHAVRVSPGLLPLLGARPVLGRLLDADDENSVVLSEAAWDRHFARAPDVIGRRLLSADQRASFTVVGVVGTAFHFPNAQTHAWTRLPLEEAARAGRFVANVAKLREGVSTAAASSELAMLGNRITGSELRSPQSSFEVRGLHGELVAGVRPTIRVLALVVAVLLLVACANVANLFVAQVTSRRREIAVRAALGASRWRLVRQMLTESLLISCLSGALGLGIAAAGLRILRTMFMNLSPPIQIRQVGSLDAFPRLDEIALESATFTFAAILCLITAVLAGVVPVFRHASRVNAGALREGVSPAATGFGVLRRLSTRRALVVSQVALATVLLTAGGLVVGSFVKLLNVEKGYDARDLLVVRVRTPRHESVQDRRRLADQFVERLRAIPGVTAASYASQMPLAPRSSRIPLRIRPGEDLPPPPDDVIGKSAYFPDLRRVGPGYLGAMGTEVVAGRRFTDAGVSGAGREVLVNETLARDRFPGQNPVGRHVYLGANDPEPWEIVGVAQDIRQWGLDLAPDPQVFVDLSRWPSFGPADTPQYFVVRSTLDTHALLPHLREALRQLDGDGYPEHVLRMEEDILSSALAAPRMRAMLFGVFAGLGLTLAAVGVYGVMAYTVARSTRELAVRLAIGARTHELLRMVLARAGALTVTGVVLGWAGAAAVAQALETMLYGLSPLDATTFGGVGIVFVSVALVGAYIPARRAMRVDPLAVLRSE